MSLLDTINTTPAAPMRVGPQQRIIIEALRVAHDLTDADDAQLPESIRPLVAAARSVQPLLTQIIALLTVGRPAYTHQRSSSGLIHLASRTAPAPPRP